MKANFQRNDNLRNSVFKKYLLTGKHSALTNCGRNEEFEANTFVNKKREPIS